jgi:hypothetical protein
MGGFIEEGVGIGLAAGDKGEGDGVRTASNVFNGLDGIL